MQTETWTNDGSKHYKITPDERKPHRYIKASVSRNTKYRFFHALLSFGGDDENDWQLCLAIPKLFSIFLSLNGIGKFWKDSDKRFWKTYETGFTYREGLLWLRLLYDDNGYCYGGFRKRKQIVINFENLIFGLSKHSKEALDEPTPIRIPMPEGNYDATIQHILHKWTFPRFRKPIVITRTEIEVPNPPQFAGKGENGWDMDDDGIESWSIPSFLTADEAAHEYREAVLKERRKYGEPSAY